MRAVQRQATLALRQPLLKWAGGKRQLLPGLAEHYPATFTRYIEPFFGSGAVFFDLLNAGRLGRCDIQLCDVNPDLIGCYWTVRDRTDEVIRALQGWRVSTANREATATTTFGIGDSIPPVPGCRRRHRTRTRSPSRYTPATGGDVDLSESHRFQRAVSVESTRRVQRAGGRYTDPRICDERHLRAVAGALRQPRVSVTLSLRRDAGATPGAETSSIAILRTPRSAAHRASRTTPRRLHVVRSVAPSAGGDRRVPTRGARRRVELECLGDHEGLHDARGAAGAVEDQPRPGETRHQLACVLAGSGR